MAFVGLWKKNWSDITLRALLFNLQRDPPQYRAGDRVLNARCGAVMGKVNIRLPSAWCPEIKEQLATASGTNGF
jgi:hypothetical protein